MMKKKNTLSVKPLRRYNTPVYPSYLDKNPIEHPDTLPYPFSYKALQALAATGILVGASCSPTKNVSDNSPVIQTEMTQDSLFNPFTFENLRVPYMPASFGTGMASRLKGDEARAVINKIFQEEGIDLEKNYFYKKDSITVVLNGFNADLNIGYIWVDGYNMGDGMVLSRNESIQKLSAYERMDKNIIDSYFKGDLEETEKRIEREIARQENEPVRIKYLGQFNEAKLISNIDDKITAYKAVFINFKIQLTAEGEPHAIKRYNEKYTEKTQETDYTYQARDYFQKHLNENSTQEEKERVFTNWNLRDKMEFYLRGKDMGKATKQQIRDIMDDVIALENEKEKIQKYGELLLFLDYYRGARRAQGEAMKEIVEVFKADNNRKVLDNMQKFVVDKVDRKLTLQEAHYLKNIHKTEKDFIAPIGTRDGRFFYRRGIPKFTKEEEEKLEKIREKIKKSSNKEEYKQAYFEARAAAEKRDPKDEALKALETQVRQYIQWAKQQGAY